MSRLVDFWPIREDERLEPGSLMVRLRFGNRFRNLLFVWEKTEKFHETKKISSPIKQAHSLNLVNWKHNEIVKLFTKEVLAIEISFT